MENDIRYFVKYNRVKNGMTQEVLASKAGVGLRFIRELEQGKTSLRIDKVNQVLALFGHKMIPGKSHQADPYEILRNHVNKAVHIVLKNRKDLFGIILEPEYNKNREITMWRFVPNNHAIKYKKNKDEALIQRISHEEIENIKNIDD